MIPEMGKKCQEVILNHLNSNEQYILFAEASQKCSTRKEAKHGLAKRYPLVSYIVIRREHFKQVANYSHTIETWHTNCKHATIDTIYKLMPG